ncbi:MAG: RuvC family protein [Vulcanimicrobiaceae bacterium]
MNGAILGVDPGTRKVGYALLDAQGTVLERGIEEPLRLRERLLALAKGRTIQAIALGKGTNARLVRAELTAIGAPIHLVDERSTSLGARTLYFDDHPPRGWRRLIPRSMQLPPCPIDDYAAVLIARRLLAEGLFERPS